MKMEYEGKPSLEDILAIVSGKRQKECYEKGDVESGAIPMGECAGRIHEIASVKEVIDEIVEGAEKLLK